MSESETFYQWDPETEAMIPVTVQKPSQADTDKAVRAEIARVFGPNVSAQDTLRFWPSVAKKLASSNISGVLRSWIKADAAYAAQVGKNASLAAAALEQRNLLENRISAAGWKVPKSRAP